MFLPEGVVFDVISDLLCIGYVPESIGKAFLRLAGE
jgi:hypothetical protein